jgi:hypothetical protein
MGTVDSRSEVSDTFGALYGPRAVRGGRHTSISNDNAGSEAGEEIFGGVDIVENITQQSGDILVNSRDPIYLIELVPNSEALPGIAGKSIS